MRGLGGTGQARLWVVAAAIASLAIAAPAAADDGGDHRIVAGLTEVPEQLDVGDRHEGFRVVDLDRTLRFVVVEAGSVDEVRDALDEDEIRYVERDLRVTPQLEPSDPRYDDQYGPQQVQAPAAWDVTLGDTDAAVCIVDSGLRQSHVEFPDERILGDKDFRNDDGQAEYNGDHGTHVTGIAAAQLDDDQLIAGLGNTGIYVAEAMGGTSGQWSDVAQAIRWCSERDTPTVINLSLGSSSSSSTGQEAIDHAWDQGSLLVAAAGNDGCSGCVSYPARDGDVIAVSCTDADERLCSFSSYGPAVELAAPGDGILSTETGSDEDVGEKSGTSMSSPHVAGAAALAWSLNPDLTNEDLRQRLRDHADDLGPSGEDDRFGHGLLDAGGLAASVPLFDDPHPIEHWSLDGGLPDEASTGGLWHADDACASPPSNPYYVGYHREDACSYDTGEQTYGGFKLPVDLRGIHQANLSFEQVRDVEDSDADNVDIMRVDASTDGGSSWDQVARWSPADGDTDGWEHANVSLTSFLGEEVTLRWWFDSADSLMNDETGWLVDDVHVHGVSNLRPQPALEASTPVSDDDGDGEEPVRLDASASEDTDGTVEAHRWYVDGTHIGTASAVEPTLAVGHHDVRLEVEDDDGGVTERTLALEVQPNQVPEPVAPELTVKDEDADGQQTVELDATGSRDPDGSITSYEWRLDGETVGTEARVNVTLTTGDHTANLTVTDNGGAEVSDEANVTVLDNYPPRAATGPDVTARDPDADGQAQVRLGSPVFAGRTDTSDSAWTSIGFEPALDETPTVLVQPQTHNGAERALYGEASAVTASDARIRYCESDGLDGCDDHAAETLAWLVLPQGTLRAGDGDRMLATGATSGLADATPTEVPLPWSFFTDPYVFATTQTANGGQDPSHAQVLDRTQDSFQTRHCEYERSDGCDDHAEETNGWTALHPDRVDDVHGIEAGTLRLNDQDARTISFGTPFPNRPLVFAQPQTRNGTEDAVLASVTSVTADEATIELCEHEGPDACDGHAHETVAWLAIDPVTAGLVAGDPEGNLVDAAWLDDGIVLAEGTHAEVTAPVGEHTYTLRVTDQADQTTERTLSVNVLPNQDPIADAGPDRIAPDGDGDGTETFALDASGSHDPDGSITDVTWLEDGTVLATGLQAEVGFAVGEHELTLEIHDDGNGTASGTVNLTVEPNQAPVAVGTSERVRDGHGNGSAEAPLDAADSYDLDGSVTDYRWTLDGETIAHGADTSAQLPVGTEEVTLHVTDNGAATANTTVDTEVLANRAPHARFDATCVLGVCRLDGHASADRETYIAEHRWTVDGASAGEEPLVDASLSPHEANSVQLTVEDTGGAEATEAREVTPDAPGTVQPRKAVPEDPVVDDPTPFWHVPGTEQPQVRAAWFDHDPTHVYVGFDAESIPTPSQAATGYTYTVSVTPDWTPEDPTWHGVRPEDHTVQGLRFYATGGTLLDPTTTQLQIELVTEAPSGFTTWNRIATLEGSVDPASDTVWWIAPRELVQVPVEGARFTDVEASVTASGQPIETARGEGPVPIPPGQRPGVETRYDSFDDGPERYERAHDQLASAVHWDPRKTAIRLQSDRSDPGDERLRRELASPLDETTSFTVTARWSLEDDGHWQRMHPLYLAEDDPDQVGEDAGQLVVRYSTREPARGGPSSVVSYIDSQGETRLKAKASTPADAELTFWLRYNATERQLTGAIAGPGDELLALDTYELDSHPENGFAFTEIGTAADGRQMAWEPPAIGHLDDVLVHRGG